MQRKTMETLILDYCKENLSNLVSEWNDNMTFSEFIVKRMKNVKELINVLSALENDFTVSVNRGVVTGFLFENSTIENINSNYELILDTDFIDCDMLEDMLKEIIDDKKSTGEEKEKAKKLQKLIEG